MKPCQNGQSVSTFTRHRKLCTKQRSILVKPVQKRRAVELVG